MVEAYLKNLQLRGRNADDFSAIVAEDLESLGYVLAETPTTSAHRGRSALVMSGDQNAGTPTTSAQRGRSSLHALLCWLRGAAGRRLCHAEATVTPGARSVSSRRRWRRRWAGDQASMRYLARIKPKRLKAIIALKQL